MIELFVLAMPAAVLVWFIVSLNDFLKCPKEDYRRKNLKVMMIISAVVLGIMVLAIAVLIIILSLGMVHM